jgi:hypothetical protein
MSFIDMELDAIEEDKPVAEGEYNLVITDVKEKNDESGNLKGLLVILEVEGQTGSANVLHNCSFPLPGDDENKQKNKKLFLKRFLVQFGIPFANGLDLTRFPGARAKCFLKQEEYNGVVSNKIVLPMMK